MAYGLCLGAVALAANTAYRLFSQQVSDYLRQRSTEAAEQLGELFLNLPQRTLWTAYALAPLAAGGLAWLLTERWVLGLTGAALGIVVPRVVIAQVKRAREQTFHAQLVDALLIMSSSLKAGLSMMQAFTVIAEEMPPPIAQEFGLILKQTRMGVGLEEAIGTLKRRMPSDDLMLFATAVLVSRETGGDVTHLFARLVETLRERKKLRERIKTLTFMARLQGAVMGALPILFGVSVSQMNREYFSFFLTDPTGRLLLVVVVVLQIVGGLLFLRFARSPL